MSIVSIDHVAFAVVDLDKTISFYCDVLDGRLVGDPYVLGGRVAVRRVLLGGALLSIHQFGNGVFPVAAAPTPGGLDICFRWDGTIDSAVAYLGKKGIDIIEGPAKRSLSSGEPAVSVYFRDLDGNLIELMARDTAVIP